ncbi:MAG: hydantoinase/oxoprolinase N-terminal domain-containing protein, partial [Pseudomonadota bacterium]
MTSESIRVGADIGGTFTDVALMAGDSLTSCKVLTDYANPEAAILEGIRQAAGQAGIDLSQIGQV